MILLTPNALRTVLQRIHDKVLRLGGYEQVTPARLAREVQQRKVVSRANLDLAAKALAAFTAQHPESWNHVVPGNAAEPADHVFYCSSPEPTRRYREHAEHRCKMAAAEGHPVSIRWIGAPWNETIYRPRWALWGRVTLQRLAWREAGEGSVVGDLDRAWYAPPGLE